MKKYPNPFSLRDNFLRYKDVKSHLLWGNPNEIPDPKISVIMPVYNHPDYFEEALLSAIQQDCEQEYEIIVVDNNAFNKDKTLIQEIVEKINSKNVLYYRNAENIGMFGNWNRGIELSRAPYVTFLHDDDKFLESTVSLLCSFQSQTGERALIAPNVLMDATGKHRKIEQFTPKKKLFGLIREKYCYNYSLLKLIITMPSQGGGCMFNRDVMLRIGGYDEDLYPGSDYGILFKYQKYVGLLYINQPNYLYRIADNASMTVWKEFPLINNHLWDASKIYIKIPRIILDQYTKALSHQGEIYLNKTFGKENPKSLPALSRSEKSWLKIFEILNKISCYEF